MVPYAPKQQRAVATREAILRAAGELFATTSFVAANVTTITGRAQVTQGALYFHFASKKDLALAVIKRQHELSTAFEGDPASIRAVEYLVYSGLHLAHQLSTNPIVRGGLRLSTESADLFPEYVRVPYADWIAFTEHLLIRGIDEGDIDPRIDPKTFSNLIVETFAGSQIVSQAISSWRDFPDRLDRLHVLISVMFAPGRLPEINAMRETMKTRLKGNDQK